MRRLGVLLTVAACGGSAKQVSDTSAHRAPPAPAPCPTGAALDEIAARAWDTTDPFRDPWCTALHVGDQTEWWIAGDVNDDEPGTYGWTPREALVTPNGDVLWSQKLPYDEYQPEASEQQARDLDGDGVDELLYVATGGEGGGSTTTLIVVGIAGGKPRSARADLGYSYEDEGCVATWSIDGGTIVIAGEGSCETFSGRFRWDGSTLVTE